jgi:hypothetical protein
MLLLDPVAFLLCAHILHTLGEAAVHCDLRVACAVEDGWTLHARLHAARRRARPDLTAANIYASTSPATFQALAFEDYAPVLGSASDRRDHTREAFGYN